MAKRAKASTQYVIYCPHCKANDFKLDDVRPEDEVKFYSDTPFKIMSQIT